VYVDTSDLEGALQQLEQQGKNLSGATREIAEGLVKMVEQEIQTEGDGRWAPLALSTVRQKGGAKALVDSGQFARSIRPRSTSDTAMAESRVPYAVYHLAGGRHVPKRNPFEQDEADFEDAADVVAQELVER
jgi:phage gpG-like protein